MSRPPDPWKDAEEDPEPWEWERRWRLLLEEVIPGERVLDLGCGAGRFVGALANAGVDVVGVDVSPEALQRARRNVPAGDFRQLREDGTAALEHQSVDLVWCSEVVEHVADTAGFLLEVRRVLKPGGRLLLTTPFHGRTKNVLVSLFTFEKQFDPLSDHLRFYTKKSLESVLVEAGFVRVVVSPHGGPPLLRTSLVARALRG